MPAGEIRLELRRAEAVVHVQREVKVPARQDAALLADRVHAVNPVLVAALALPALRDAEGVFDGLPIHRAGNVGYRFQLCALGQRDVENVRPVHPLNAAALESRVVAVHLDRDVREVVPGRVNRLIVYVNVLRQGPAVLRKQGVENLQIRPRQVAGQVAGLPDKAARQSLELKTQARAVFNGITVVLRVAPHQRGRPVRFNFPLHRRRVLLQLPDEVAAHYGTLAQRHAPRRLRAARDGLRLKGVVLRHRGHISRASCENCSGSRDKDEEGCGALHVCPSSPLSSSMALLMRSAR